MLTHILWNVSPDITTLNIAGNELPLRWYGILFVVGFLIGQQIVYYIYRKEGKPSGDVDSITIYVVAATVVGARLGHYLFYEWQTLLNHPARWLVELVTPPFSGLASHGGMIGILIALYLYARTRADQPFLWVTDRMAIAACIGGAAIRLGNLMNSEIYGGPTSLPWGFIFQRETDPSLLPLTPRHPTQLYEALICLILFVVLFYVWKNRRSTLPSGVMTGIFMIVIFGSRFLIEFLKNDQKEFESTLLLNMGQILSIPIILAGIAIIILAYKRASSRIRSTTRLSD